MKCPVEPPETSDTCKNNHIKSYRRFVSDFGLIHPDASNDNNFPFLCFLLFVGLSFVDCSIESFINERNIRLFCQPIKPLFILKFNQSANESNEKTKRNKNPFVIFAENELETICDYRNFIGQFRLNARFLFWFLYLRHNWHIRDHRSSGLWFGLRDMKSWTRNKIVANDCERLSISSDLILFGETIHVDLYWSWPKAVKTHAHAIGNRLHTSQRNAKVQRRWWRPRTMRWRHIYRESLF